MSAPDTTIRLLAFGITRDFLGGRHLLHWPLAPNTPVAELRTRLLAAYPALSGLPSLAIAINGEYALDEDIIQPNDEVALIPPVSGG